VGSKVRREGGASAVEFALILPLLLMLAFGAIWGGIAYNRQLALTQSAREGARFAATLPLPASGVPDATWYASVRARITSTSVGQLDGPTAYTCIRVYGSGGTLVGAPSEDGPTGGDPSCGARPTLAQGTGATTLARVEVEVARPSNFDWFFGGGEVRLRATSVARYETPGVAP
jgi:hypothetical protein